MNFSVTYVCLKISQNVLNLLNWMNCIFTRYKNWEKRTNYTFDRWKTKTYFSTSLFRHVHSSAYLATRTPWRECRRFINNLLTSCVMYIDTRIINNMGRVYKWRPEIVVFKRYLTRQTLYAIIMKKKINTSKNM